MKVVIAGATGFLGQPLARALAADGQDIVILTRRTDPPRPTSAARFLTWRPGSHSGPWAAEIEGAAAVINLAGESIAASRWSNARKQHILDSRVQATRTLADAILGASRPPAVFISGSAVGYYGPCGDEVVTENQSPGSDFLAEVCTAWEAEAGRAESVTRVACIRTGLVIEEDGGALPRMALPFKFGAGGPLGSGSQYMPWIHRDDWVALVRWTLATATAIGPINATAPNPVTNAEFARALGRALHRPAFMPAPAFALRLALGEMADALLLSGQRAVPAKAERLGFRFRFTQVDDALGAIFSG
ncbi:MAG: TIGR01777 family oxidoreductase [Acidobacteriota bacterium]